MVFVDRSPRKSDRWLHLKVWSFSVGSVLAVAGMALESQWMIYVAIVVLAAGFVARFLPQEDESRDAGGGPGEADEGATGPA